MLELVMVRHGETDSNKNGKYLGWTDVELNKYGISQAEKARDRLKHISFDVVISSPLKRARETAEIISEDVIYDSELKETNFGLWDNLSFQEIKEKYPQDYKLWMKDWGGFIFPSGESVMDMHKRAVNFVDKIINEKQEGTVLIVTHAGLIRSIIAYLLGMGIAGAWHFCIDNCSITRIQITDGYSVLTELNG
ncbi:alpha-ribazole phosphatase [Clostridium sp. WILCCON 0269]|uniref:Alpha-ribazole phosphatase n=1 Tax=Candidatus Clostridium eludens TaxID=3381663 RepID=A0ABW8SFR0_9CLOT